MTNHHALINTSRSLFTSLQHYPQLQQHEPLTDISIWISEQQVRTLSGYSLRIFAIENGRVSQILRDPAFDSYLPMM